MLACAKTVAFSGISADLVDVQIQMINGIPSFTIVGLPDKAVAESKERIKSSLFSIGLSLPARHIIVNLSPADVLKEGSHYDLPIALALLSSMGVLKQDDLDEFVTLGELSLNGGISRVPGCLPAAIFAKQNGLGLICPASCGQEVLWAGENNVLAASDLLSVINHLNGTQVLSTLSRNTEEPEQNQNLGCISNIKGQFLAKRALEIAAAGAHNMLMKGPPGVGKSMLASRISTILPPLTSKETLEITMIHSLAGQLKENGLITSRPFRTPHHSASLIALVGGGRRAQPGEISLAHRGVLFLDELPEFSRTALESLRQPLETGNITIARANHHVNYPARIQLIAAMNPCRCGYLGNARKECSKSPKCGEEYLQKISGPLIDRIDIFIDVPDVNIQDLSTPNELLETSEKIQKRVVAARNIQIERYKNTNFQTNAEAEGDKLTKFVSQDAQNLLYRYMEKSKISARGYYRIIKLARTLADLESSDSIGQNHIAEAITYRN